MITSMSFVFSNLFGMNIVTYGLMLFSGMLGYQIFSGIFGQCSNCLINNENLIKQTPINLIIFPLSAAIAAFIDGILLLIALVIFMFFVGKDFYLTVFWVPLILSLLFLFALGTGMAASVIVIKARDLGHAIPLGLQILLFISPVFYKGSDITGKLSTLIYFNPLTWFIEPLRGALLYNTSPSQKQLLVLIFITIIALIFGKLVFKSQSSRVSMRL